MKLGFIVAILLATLQTQAQSEPVSKKFCEAEMQAQDAIQLTPEQRDALSYYKTFNANTNSRSSVGSDLIHRHLDSAQSSSKSDDSPVSACLLKAFADGSNENPTAPLAQEAYALRLLEGSGVPRNKNLAIEYLERSARWSYASAATHLGKLYLADTSNSGSRVKAISWLEFAAFNSINADSVGGWSAGPDLPINILFKLYTSAKDWTAAEDLYRRARNASYPKDRLAVQLLRIPGLKARIDAEDYAAAQADADRRLAEASRQRERVCVTYRSGFKDCRYY